mmetsp:Transcript_57518/g.145840  ORF Transcript_57518/g.145840 Transcript_57518/m.145840 type:complete len:160 (-) Transcript_57518:927-1406(-)
MQPPWHVQRDQEQQSASCGSSCEPPNPQASRHGPLRGAGTRCAWRSPRALAPRLGSRQRLLTKTEYEDRGEGEERASERAGERQSPAAGGSGVPKADPRSTSKSTPVIVWFTTADELQGESGQPELKLTAAVEPTGDMSDVVTVLDIRRTFTFDTRFFM